MFTDNSNEMLTKTESLTNVDMNRKCRFFSVKRNPVKIRLKNY